MIISPLIGTINFSMLTPGDIRITRHYSCGTTNQNRANSISHKNIDPEEFDPGPQRNAEERARGFAANLLAAADTDSGAFDVVVRFKHLRPGLVVQTADAKQLIAGNESGKKLLTEFLLPVFERTENKGRQYQASPRYPRITALVP